MPTLAVFGAMRIAMYFEDHNPPHVHVYGVDFQALVAIADASILRGHIPARYRRTALRWIAANRAMLIEQWERLH